MELYNKLSKDMMDAMKSHDKNTLSTLRLLKSAIDLQKINNKLTEITDELVIEVASRQVKQHKESITEFRNAGRDDLADNLEREIKIISNYLPEQLSKEEIVPIVQEIINETGATSIKDMGKVMGQAKAKLGVSADGKTISECAKELLNK